MNTNFQYVINNVVEELNANPEYTMTYKQYIGKIHKEIKEKYLSSCNHDELKILICKGKNKNRTVTAHQAAQGASIYAVQYHFKEAYTMDIAIIKGCILWNNMNDCKFFTCKIPKSQEKPICKEMKTNDKELYILQKMCRKHHRIVNTKLIKEMGNELFWSYFENAIKQIPKTKLITENVVETYLKKWNEEQGVSLFKV